MHTVTSRDGTVIAYDRAGDGPPLILIDGAMCHRAAGPMSPLAKHLEPHFTVLTYDRRGRGDSGDTTPYSVAREVEDIEALIKEAAGEVRLFGISSGGMLALEAARRGLPVAAVAMLEPPFPVEGRPNASEDFAARLADLTSAGRHGDAVEYFMTTMVGLDAEMVAQSRRSPMWPALEAIAPTLVYDATITDAATMPDSVTVPGLILASGGSPAWLREAARRAGDAMPRGRFRLLEGTFHDAPPEILVPVLTEFFPRRRETP